MIYETAFIRSTYDNVNIATGSNNTVKYLVNKFKIHRFIAI